MIPKFFQWTDEHHDQLAVLTAEGKTAGQIALIMGVSRNAIIGKLSRLGIKRDVPLSEPVKAATPRVRKPKPKPSPKPDMPPNLGLTPMSPSLFCADPDDALDHSILALDHDSCRWPIGDPRDDGFRYCCASKRGPGPYCSVHHGVAFVRKLDEAAW